MPMYRDGNILASGADLIVNPVNCKGRMGKGLAKEIATRYPYALPRYRAICNAGGFRPGGVQIAPAPSSKEPWIANLATKDHWRDLSQMSWVIEGMETLAQQIMISDYSFASVAVPQLGCGNGGLEWKMVLPAILPAIGKIEALGVEVLVYGKNVLKATPRPQEAPMYPGFY